MFPHKSKREVLHLSGYKGNRQAAEKYAQRLTKNYLVQEALKEAALCQLAGLIPKVTMALSNIVDDPEHPSHFRAVDGVLNRVGLHDVTETKKTVTHAVDVRDLVAKIRSMAERLNIGLYPDKLKLIGEAEKTSPNKEPA